MSRHTLVDEVSRALGHRRLVWAGLRGDDIEPLADLPQLGASFSILSRYTSRSSVTAIAYEDLTGVREDPEVWDIDEHLDDPATTEFRRGLLAALGGGSAALLPYRPSSFLSSLWFARREASLNLGLFSAQQAAFEHKPWVESSLRSLGIPGVPWRYIADEDQLDAYHRFPKDGVLLRRSRTSGGEGFVRVTSPEDLHDLWPRAQERFMSVAPYLASATPLNVGATVWPETVTVHHPSVQLVGIPQLVTRPFGYCGNDFGLMKDTEPAIVDEVESITIRVGEWLRSQGYLGTFGVDFLVHDGQVLFSEVNPRFQGSTHASCRLSIEEDRACLMLEHLASRLGLGPPPRPPLRDLVAESSTLAHVVFHSVAREPITISARRAAEAFPRHDTLSLELWPAPETTVMPGAAVTRWTTRQRVTSTGFDLVDTLADIPSAVIAHNDARSAP